MVLVFELGRWLVAQGFHQPMVVEPRDPFQRRQFDRLLGLSRPAAVDHLCLVEPCIDSVNSCIAPVRHLLSAELDVLACPRSMAWTWMLRPSSEAHVDSSLI